MDWRNALMKLHVSGWDTDDVDEACEALCEACSGGALAGTPILRLREEDVERILDAQSISDVLSALLAIADLRTRNDEEAQALDEALYDLDAFAYAYAGDD